MTSDAALIILTIICICRFQENADWSINLSTFLIRVARIMTKIIITIILVNIVIMII